MTRYSKKKKTQRGASKQATQAPDAAASESDETTAALSASIPAKAAAQRRPTEATQAIAREPKASRAQPTDVVDTLAASLKDGGGFYFAPSRSAIENSKGRKIESVAMSDAAEGGSLLKLTGGDPSAPSHGLTGGFSIRVPDAFEREASEHTVRVRVLARSAGDASTRMAVAYSTAEVGNSGWQWRDVGPMWSIRELVWKVPKMINGNGDYIGLMPDEPGMPGVEIHSISATVV